jgi:hypothetical protein
MLRLYHGTQRPEVSGFFRPHEFFTPDPRYASQYATGELRGVPSQVNDRVYALEVPKAKLGEYGTPDAELKAQGMLGYRINPDEYVLFDANPLAGWPQRPAENP